MGLELISKIVRELILENDRVSLPGMGSFIAEMAPSVFSDRARVIHPPFRRVLFRPSEVWNDELLEREYAKERGIEKKQAKEEISEFVEELKSQLKVTKSVQIPDFGTMRATEQNDYFFVANKDLFNYTETFGLNPLNIRPVSKRGELEKLEIRFTGMGSKDNLDSEDDRGKVAGEDGKDNMDGEEDKGKLASKDGKDKISKTSSEKPKTNSKFVKRVTITLSVILFVLLVILIFSIFSDELRPFWEWILYNQEERELLRKAGSTY